MDIQPIPPSQVVDAAGKVGENFVILGQGLSGTAAIIALLVAGVLILVGLVCSALNITKKILAAGVLMLFGTAIMYVLTNNSVEIVGILKGVIALFFNDVSSQG